MSRTPGDLPRQELLRSAVTAYVKYTEAGRGVTVYFKFTCEKCGERCTLAEPNTLREQGECHACGHLTEITEGGYLLVITRHA